MIFFLLELSISFYFNKLCILELLWFLEYSRLWQLLLLFNCVGNYMLPTSPAGEGWDDVGYESDPEPDPWKFLAE